MHQIIEKEGVKYWRDDRRNLWEYEGVDYEEAQRLSRSLLDHCYANFECSDMRNSNNCSHSMGLQNCSGCIQCYGLRDCYGCYGLRHRVGAVGELNWG